MSRRQPPATIVRTGDGSLTVYSPDYRQTFHSDRGAVAEARHVFLERSGVRARLEAGQATTVLEVGFGLGLNFFITADHACATGTRLHYTALEQVLPEPALLARLRYHDHLRYPELVASFLAFRRGLSSAGTGTHRFTAGPTELELILGDASGQPLPSSYHAIYLDAFSPDANPELWAPTFLATLADALEPAGRLVSYSVKGTVRRRLAALGLEVAKQPGPAAGKREMLVAVRGAR